MKFRIRKASLLRDLPFYIRVLRNKETQTLMFDRRSMVWSYIFLPKCKCKYVCQRFVNGHWESVSVAHFVKGQNEVYWMSGAIPRELYNSGIGIYAAVAFLDSFFKSHPNAIVKSGAFLSNPRSFRTTTSIGFTLDKKDDNHFENSITKELFNNDFANKIKKRLDL